MKTMFKSIYNNEEDDPLQKQFKTLEIEWDSIKQLISRSDRRSSTTTTIAVDNRLLHLYDNSPKKLMSLLQNDYTPSIHQNQAAVEVIEHQEDNFDDGRLKGRRLFEESEMGSDNNGGCFDVDEQSEVSTEVSFHGFEDYDGFCQSCTDSPRSDVVEMVVAVNGCCSGGGGSIGKWIVCVVMMIFAFAIVVLECSIEDEHILVPT